MPAWRRTAIVTMALLGLRGEWFALVVGSLVSSQPFEVALASESQFFLETLVLGVFSGLAYQTITQASNHKKLRSAC